MAEAWGQYLQDVVQKRPGRAVLSIVGTAAFVFATLVAVFGADERQTTAHYIGAAGVLLLVVGCVPIRRAKLPGVEFETHDSEATSKYAEPVSEPSPEDPEARVDESAPVPEVTEGELTSASRYLAGDRAIRSLLTPTSGLLADCELHLYVFDSIAQKLLPVFEPDDPASEGWAPGVGCTGVAYAERKLVVAIGDETADETFNLSPEQQRRYQDLTAVAAVPVTNAKDDVIAVLGAATRQSEPPLGTPQAEDELLSLALAVGRILVDLLKWFPDDDER